MYLQVCKKILRHKAGEIKLLQQMCVVEGGGGGHLIKTVFTF